MHSGFLFAGSGAIGSSHDYYTICKQKDADDYTKIDKWIKELPDYLN